MIIVSSSVKISILKRNPFKQEYALEDCRNISCIFRHPHICKTGRGNFYTLFSNKHDWAKKYIHPYYFKHLEASTTVEQPCPDGFWFQVATDAFCDDRVAIVEKFGKWPDDSNKDLPGVLKSLIYHFPYWGLLALLCRKGEVLECHP